MISFPCKDELLSAYHNVVALTGHLLLLLWVVHQNLVHDEHLIILRKLHAISANYKSRQTVNKGFGHRRSTWCLKATKKRYYRLLLQLIGFCEARAKSIMAILYFSILL